MSADNDNNLTIRPIRRKSARSTTTYLTWLVMVLIAVVGGAIILSLLGEPRAPRTSAERDLAVFEQRVKEKPGDPDAQAGMGAALMQAGSYERAVEYLNAAIRLEAKPKYRIALAEVYVAMGDTKKAIAELRIVQEHNADYEQAWFAEGKIYYDKGQYSKSLEPFMRSLVVQPGSSDVHYLLGHAQEKLGESEEAIHQYQKALIFLPDYEEALEGLKRLGAKPLEQEPLGAGH